MNENRLLNKEFIYQNLVKSDRIHRFINKGTKNMIHKASMDKIGASRAFDLSRFASGYYNYSNYPYKETPLFEKIFYYIREFIGWGYYILHVGFISVFIILIVLSPFILLTMLIMKLLQGR